MKTLIKTIALATALASVSPALAQTVPNPADPAPRHPIATNGMATVAPAKARHHSRMRHHMRGHRMMMHHRTAR